MVRFTKHSPQKCEVYKALWRKWLPGVTEKWEERENYQLWELKVAHTGNCWSWLNHNDPQNIFAGSKFVVIWELEIWGEGIMWRVLLWDCVWVCVCVCVTHCGIFFQSVMADLQCDEFCIYWRLQMNWKLFWLKDFCIHLFFMIMKVYIHRGST